MIFIGFFVVTPGSRLDRDESFRFSGHLYCLSSSDKSTQRLSLIGLTAKCPECRTLSRNPDTSGQPDGAGGRHRSPPQLGGHVTSFLTAGTVLDEAADFLLRHTRNERAFKD
jgi:hypothetical protein